MTSLHMMVNRLVWSAALLGAIAVVATSAAQTRPPERTLKETLRIDGNTELFSNIGTVYVARSGTIVIPSGKDSQLLLYNASGKRFATFGRKGAGPGEFQFTTGGAYGWLGDSLWVYDSGNQRITFATDRGKLIGTQPLTLYLGADVVTGRNNTGSRPNSIFPWAFTPNGLLVSSAQFEVRRPGIDSAIVENQIVVLARDGTVRTVTLRFPAPAFQLHATTGGVVVGARPVFEQRRSATVSARGTFHLLAAGKELSNGSTALDVVLVSDRGDTLYSKSIAVPGVPIPKTASDSAITAVLRNARPAAAISANSRPSLGAMSAVLEPEIRKRLPKNYPPLLGSFVGEDGIVWLKVTTGPDTFQWWSLNARGVPQAAITIPKRGNLSWAKGDTVLVAERDDDDVPSLVKYVLLPARPR